VGSLHPSSSDRHPTTNVGGFSLVDAYVSKRVLTGHHLNGCLASVSEPLRPLLEYLDTLSGDEQRAAWHGALLLRSDQEAIRQAVFNVDPDGPMPDTATARQRTAHLGDLDGYQAKGRFAWPKWLVRSHFNLLSSDPKVGKTHLALDIARRLYFGLCWPDKQEPTFPEGTKTLWVCGDRHQDELRERAAAFKLPPEAVLLNADADEPYGGWDLDNPDNLKALEERIRDNRPGLVIIDTVWRATRRRLYREDQVNELFDPLITMAQECDTTFWGLMHLSKDHETLGRRLDGLARAILKLFYPDPSQPNRRKLTVIGNFKEADPLGMTMLDGGCDFDSTPPEEAAKSTGGRPSVGRDTACDFIRKALTTENDLIGNDLCSQFQEETSLSEKTFWRAVREMEAEGDLTTDGGRGTGKQTVLHLSGQNPKPPLT
jgi:hypothetical protein